MYVVIIKWNVKVLHNYGNPTQYILLHGSLYSILYLARTRTHTHTHTHTHNVCGVVIVSVFFIIGDVSKCVSIYYDCIRLRECRASETAI